MTSAANSRPALESAPASVAAPTLEGALRRARALYGDDACILDTRRVALRESDGLGQSHAFEVLVGPPGTARALSARPRSRPPARAEADLTASLAGEVDRIERLVETIAGGRRPQEAAGGQPYPLAEALRRAGASREAVQRLASLYRDHPAAARGDPEAARTHLRAQLRTSKGAWETFGGGHLFLGGAGAGKSDLVLGTAARLRRASRRVLVLSLLPRHGGEIRRLQLEAARHGYDAAVMHDPGQLARHAGRFADYDAVLVDTPALEAPALAAAGDLQSHVAQNATLHRHLVVPLDADLLEQAALWEAARRWNCDWTALTRLDRTRRPGKLLDLLARVSFPVSLCARGAWPEREPELAGPGQLADWLLGQSRGELAAAAGA